MLVVKKKYQGLVVVSWESVLKLAVVATGVMVALQLVFYVVFEVIGYDSFLLSATLIVSLLVAILFLIIWNLVKRGKLKRGD